MEDFRKQAEDKLAVEVEHSADKFIFTVETTGALSAKDVVKDALSQLTDKIARLQKILPTLQQH